MPKYKRKVAGIILYHRTSDSLLMIQQRFHKMWGFPKGGKEKKESMLVAAQREFLEETGLKVEEMPKEPLISLRDHNKALYYLMEITDQLEPNYEVVDQQEILAVKWFSRATIKDSLKCTNAGNLILDKIEAILSDPERTIPVLEKVSIFTGPSQFDYSSKSKSKPKPEPKPEPIAPTISESTRTQYVSGCTTFLHNYVLDQTQKDDFDQIIQFSRRKYWAQRSRKPSEYPSFVLYDTESEEYQISDHIPKNHPESAWYFSIHYLATGICGSQKRKFENLNATYEVNLLTLQEYLDQQKLNLTIEYSKS